MVIAEWQGGLFTFPADEVSGIHRYNPEELLALPDTVDTTFTRGLLHFRRKTRLRCLNAIIAFRRLEPESIVKDRHGEDLSNLSMLELFPGRSGKTRRRSSPPDCLSSKKSRRA